MPDPVIVVMGVSGSGKTTLGRAIAAASARPFQEGDDLHPAANVAKMRAGIPLDDADRGPWLDRIGSWIAAHADGGGVISCSALKRVYRDRLRAADPRLRFVFLAVPAATLRQRLQQRSGHFMAASLLDSQLATLEPPDGEPGVLTIDHAGVADNLAAVRTWLSAEWAGQR